MLWTYHLGISKINDDTIKQIIPDTGITQNDFIA